MPKAVLYLDSGDKILSYLLPTVASPGTEVSLEGSAEQVIWGTRLGN